MKTFTGEQIHPVAGTADAADMASGGPGLPRRFRWRDREYEVGEVLEKWRETGECRHKSGERYVRKHWFRFRTTTGEEMAVYFERQARSPRERKARWWVHTVNSLE